jgi:tetratricopeptide (TPR) repeat protein
MRPQTISAIAVFLLVGMSAGNLVAQSISDENRDEAVDESTRQEATKRVEQQSERLDEEEEGAAKKTGPNYSREDAKADEMSPDEIEKLKRRLERKNREMITKLDKLIEEDPHNEQKPVWMFRKAELLWELRNMEYLRKRSEYNQCMRAARQGTTDKSECEEPDPNYDDAQQIYKEVLKEYPDYARLDEVLYRLGQGLIEAEKGAQAVSYLSRLVNDYPNSKYIADANLSLAEHFFEEEMLSNARDKYKKVLNYKNNENYDYALYKLGWVYYNQSEYRDAIETFKKVVERTDETLGFQNQALNDLVTAYSEIDGGWEEMRDYFFEKRDRQFTYDKLSDIAQLYKGQGKDTEVVEVYEYFIEERPDHKRMPSWMESVIEAQKNSGVFTFEDVEQTINKYVAYLSPEGTWWKKNEANKNHRNNAELLTQASIAYLANKYHRRAQEKDENTGPDYRSAVKYYEQYIERFPNDAASFDMNFFVAEIYLLDLDDYEKAAKHYQKVVDLYKNENAPQDAPEKEIKSMVKDASYGVVNAYNELVKKHHEDSILVKMAEYEESNSGEPLQAQNQEKGPPSEKDPNERSELLKFEEGFVKASDQYSEMFPETDITPTVDFVAAEVYKARGHYKECIDRYESIIENAPDHRYASFAGNSLLEANYVLKNWAKVEKWARHLLDNKIFDVTPKASLQSSIAYAINEKAKELQDDDKTDEAADELLRLAGEFPDSELAPGAVFNAAAIYESGGEVKKAVTQYERVVDKYPEDVKAPESLFVLGLISESRANFGKAASYFARLGSQKTYTVTKDKPDGEGSEEVDRKYSEHPKAADAVFNAAELRKAMEQWDKAIAAYQKYIEMFPDRDDTRDVKLDLAYLEKRRDKPEKALERFKAFTERDDLEPKEKVELFTEIGLLVEQTEPDGWKEESNEYFTDAVDIWKNKLEGDTKKKKRHAASHARFRQAERLYKEFEDVELEFPQSVLKKRLEEKGKALNTAQEVYFEIFQKMKSPRWASAAAYRVGNMYDKFYQSIRDLPLPKGLNEQQKMEYRFFLDERAAPVQEKAVSAYSRARKVALELRAYNEWSRKSADKISDLRSAKYPITSQEGVTSDHGQIKFYTPSALTERDVAEKRLKARIERLRKKREKQRQKEKENKKGGEGSRESAETESNGEKEAPAQSSPEGGES